MFVLFDFDMLKVISVEMDLIDFVENWSFEEDICAKY